MSLIICERTGVWAAAIRKAVGSSVRLRQTWGLSACEAELAAAPDSLVAVELTSENCDVVLGWIVDLGRRFPQAAAIVLAAKQLAAYQALVCEAGAIHMLTTTRDLPLLAEIVRRRSVRRPHQQLSLAEQVWAGLPWGNAG